MQRLCLNIGKSTRKKFESTKSQLANIIRTAVEQSKSAELLHSDWRYEFAQTRPVSSPKSRRIALPHPAPLEISEDMDWEPSEIKVKLPEMQQVTPSPSRTAIQIRQQPKRQKQQQPKSQSQSQHRPQEQRRQQQPALLVSTVINTPVTSPRRRAHFADDPVTRIRYIEPARFWAHRQTAAALQEPSQVHTAVDTVSTTIEQPAMETPVQSGGDLQAISNIEAGHSFDNSTAVSAAIETAVQSRADLQPISSNEAGHDFVSSSAPPPVPESIAIPPVEDHMPMDFEHEPAPEQSTSHVMDLDDLPANPQRMSESRGDSNVGSTSTNDVEMETDLDLSSAPVVPPVQQAIAGPDITMAEEASIPPPVLQPAPVQLPPPAFAPPVPSAPVPRPVPVLSQTPGRLALPPNPRPPQQPLRREAVPQVVPPRPETAMSEEALMRQLNKGKGRVNIDRGVIPVSQEASRQADTPLVPQPSRPSSGSIPGLFLEKDAPASATQPIPQPIPVAAAPPARPAVRLEPLPQLSEAETDELQMELDLKWHLDDHGMPAAMEHHPLRMELHRREMQRKALPESEFELSALILGEIKRLKKALCVKRVPLHLKKR